MIGRMRGLAVLFVLTAASSAAADPGTGTITDAVIFEGDPPARDPVDRKTDKYCQKSGAHVSDDVVVTKGKVRDVLVRIQNGTTGDHTAPTTPVLIDQRDCNYAPRVVGVMPGQQIAVRNSDNTFHNVHG